MKALGACAEVQQRAGGRGTGSQLGCTRLLGCLFAPKFVEYNGGRIVAIVTAYVRSKVNAWPALRLFVERPD